MAAPTVAGEKVTPTVQLPPAATAPQVLLATAERSAHPAHRDTTYGWCGVQAIRERRSCVWSFVAWTTLPKLRLVGEDVTGTLPLPENVTVCVPALSVEL